MEGFKIDFVKKCLCFSFEFEIDFTAVTQAAHSVFLMEWQRLQSGVVMQQNPLAGGHVNRFYGLIEIDFAQAQMNIYKVELAQKLDQLGV